MFSIHSQLKKKEKNTTPRTSPV